MLKMKRILLIGLFLILHGAVNYASTSVKKCPQDKCLKGKECETKAPLEMACKGNTKHAVSGMQTRSVTCNSGEGWKYSDWGGDCECVEPYEWNGLFCQLKELPEVSINCINLPKYSEYKKGVLLGVKVDEALVGNMALELEIVAKFNEAKKPYKKATETYYQNKEMRIIMLADKEYEEIRQIDIEYPEVCLEEGSCVYDSCSATIKRLKWINIDDN